MDFMRIFRDMELVEQIGSGMSRILKAYDRSIFEITSSFTVVTFPFAEGFENFNGNINGNINSLLGVLKNNPTATLDDLVEVSGKSKRTVSRELKNYQESGLLHREGSRKNGKWVVE